MLLHRLQDKELIHPPKWLVDNTHYLIITGSRAYGMAGDESDNDCYGFCFPPKDHVFPHLKGEILGFGKQINRFEQYQEHHIEDKEARKEYDFSIYSIIKYFQLCMDNNPNMIDSLFVRQSEVIHITQIGQLVREARKLFLHKGYYHKTKGYAFSQLHKMKLKTPEPGSKRFESVQKYGFDVKFGCHVVRLLNQAEQVLTEGDLDLQKSKEQLKAIRNGEYSEQQIYEYFNSKEKSLEKLYNDSTLPWGAEEDKIKTLLLQCLELHYGNLDKVLHIPDKYEIYLKQISEICQKASF